MNQNNIDAEEELLKILSEELSKNIDNRIMMDILYPETIGMEEDERKIAIDGIKKRKLRKEKLDNLLNEKRQN